MKKDWILTAYLIFAAYILLDGAAYVLNPYFGRVSALICRPDGTGDSQCSVTIYGFRDTYRRSFAASAYYGAARVDYSHSTSDTWTCGITLLTTSGKFNFVHPYQPCGRMETERERVQRLFMFGGPAPSITEIYLGFNSSLYRRLAVLVLGLFTVLRWRRWRWLDYLARFDLAARARQPALRLALGWWQANLSIRLVFFVALYFTSAQWSSWYPVEQADFFSGCFQTLEHRCGTCATFPLGSLLCLYPFLTFVMLQALVQWKFLQCANSPVAGWWLAAPALAALPLVFLLAGSLECSDCDLLRFVFSGFLLPDVGVFTPPAWAGLLAFLLLLGLLQALMWRKKSAFTWGWSLVPLVNAATLWLTGMAIRVIFYRSPAEGNFLFDLGPFAWIVGGALIFLLLFLMQDVISSLYLGWMRKADGL